MTAEKELNTVLDQFHGYLSGILELYEKVVPLLQEEFDHILKDDLPALDESMKSQQALLLQTKSFDKTVTDYQTRLNVSGSTMSEMIDQFPAERRAEYTSLLNRYRNTFEEVEFYKGKCRTLLQNKLYHIDKVLSKSETQRDNTTYDQNAAGIRSSLFSKAFETKI